MARSSGFTAGAAARYSSRACGVSAAAPRCLELAEVMSADRSGFVEADHVQSAPGAATRTSAIFAACSGVETNIATRAGVLQDVRDLLGRQRRIDRHVGDAGRKARVVGDRPLRPVLRRIATRSPRLTPSVLKPSAA